MTPTARAKLTRHLQLRKPVSIDGVGRLLTNYISMSKRLYPTIRVSNPDERNIWVRDKDLLTR
jgi:hypothetical protein